MTSCKTMADRAVGGFSTASLDYISADPSSNTPAHARFHGSISTKLPANWRVERTGMLFVSSRFCNKLTTSFRICRFPQQRSRILAFRSLVLGHRSLLIPCPACQIGWPSVHCKYSNRFHRRDGYPPAPPVHATSSCQATLSLRR